ncbi:hypothetical protein ACFQL7_20585 [Halocatena marina]|uniref:Uncharacterized protein n=1 Tax=Halocatena marina TaxID=2934937 RepID=A0ABD5YRF2_9EURY
MEEAKRFVEMLCDERNISTGDWYDSKYYHELRDENGSLLGQVYKRIVYDDAEEALEKSDL